MKRTAFIFGTEDTEHVRIEVEGDTASFISHELAPTHSMAQQTRWRDRAMITDSIANIDAAWKIVTKDKPHD